MAAVKTRVLVTDDSLDMREMLRTMLELEGYDVMTARDADEALAAQRTAAAQVLITDLFMPGGDGFEAIDRFKREFPKTRILVMSGDSKLTRTDYLAAAELMGVDATLRKPFAPDALLDALKRLTG